jgi:PIN domain nuclease of toxin-antitoxin system
MKRYVTDTQCLLWYLTDDRRLPKAVNRVFDAVEKGRAQVLVPSIVLIEAIFLLQRQRITSSALDQLLYSARHQVELFLS